MKGSTKIVVSCGNRLLREAIARILTKKDEFEIVAAQVASSSFSDEIATSGADVLVHDSLEIFSGDQRLAGKASVSGRTLSYVLVAMDDNREQFLAAIQWGVLGYVLRDASAADVLSAVRAVAQGQAACPSAYTRVLFDYIAAGVEKAANGPAPVYGLTRREQQLVPLMSRGLTNKEIASRLHLSEQTVKNHIHRMMKKMQASNRVEVCDAWKKQCAATGTNIDRYFGAADASAALESTEY